MIKELNKYFEDLNVQYIDRDKLMPKRGTLSISKAQKLLGYESKYSLKDGIKKYVEFYKGIEK